MCRLVAANKNLKSVFLEKLHVDFPPKSLHCGCILEEFRQMRKPELCAIWCHEGGKVLRIALAGGVDALKYIRILSFSLTREIGGRAVGKGTANRSIQLNNGGGVG